MILRQLFCRHINTRCIHGDEIVTAGGRRVRCLDCGKPIARPLPIKCHYTGEVHRSYLVLMPAPNPDMKA